MTCIIGFKTKDHVIMGCDSYRATEYVNVPLGAVKIFKHGAYCVGVSGSMYFAQLVQHHGISGGVWDLKPEGDPLGFMVNSLIPKLREVLKESGFDEKDKDHQGSIMVAFGANVFKVAGDFYVCSTGEDFIAI